MEMKQALLVMAHDNFEQLETMMRSLDYEGFDFFVHIDARSKDVPFDRLSLCCKRSNVSFVERMKVYWGDGSQVSCSLRLLSAAMQGGGYSIFHLLTGQDMPLRPAREIWRWFDERRDSNFIGIAHSDLAGNITQEERRRWCTYYFFTQKERKAFWFKLRGVLSRLQFALGMRRGEKDCLVYGKGSACWSISVDFASWLLGRRDMVRKRFCDRTFCCDEVFMQTMLLSSPFTDSQWDPAGDEFSQNARLMDWSRPEGTGPHVWRMEDWETLVMSDRMFARKFDERIDLRVIDALCNRVQGDARFR